MRSQAKLYEKFGGHAGAAGLTVKEEYLPQIARRLDGYLKQAYKEDVFRREAVSATSFVNGFAVPHSIEVSAYESCISTLILDKPVIWGGFEVKLIILLAIRETDNHLLKIFFDWLSSIVSDSNKFTQLLEVREHQEFMEQVIM